MPRPPLDVGTHGKVRFSRTANGFRARTQFRDFDGITRPVERSGPTKGAAERSLKKAVRERTGGTSGEVIGATSLRELAEIWFGQIEVAVERGDKSPSTADTYRSVLDRHVLPGLGGLRLREATVARLDRFLTALSRNVGVSVAKTARSILSGMLGFAARRDAIPRNPVRDTAPLGSGHYAVPRALTKAERKQWIRQLEDDDKAVRWDLPDLSRFMMATGVRVGEALAVFFEDVDLEAAMVAIDHTVVRIKGKGLLRKSTKSAAGERTLPLPPFAVTMLAARLAEARQDGRPASSPVFPDSLGGLRDPSNTSRVLRECRGTDGFVWVTSHIFRKTAATILDEAGLPPRLIADQLGHAKPSMTQDVYMARKVVSPLTAAALQAAFDNESTA